MLCTFSPTYEWLGGMYGSKRALRCSNRSASIQHRLDTFLLAYRNTPHTTTKESRAMLFLHWRLRSHFDLIKPNMAAVEKAQES